MTYILNAVKLMKLLIQSYFYVNLENKRMIYATIIKL